LEQVKQDPKYHPEGDVLYHSLQVFDLARDELPYDEEFLLAALLHDVGKGIDPRNHVAAGLEALQGFITPRIHWLIENHMAAHQILDGTIGHRAKLRFQENESYDELLLLGKCDRAGRQRGVLTSRLEDAVEYLRQLSLTFGE
jgi:HD superfamily phosphodiesterase